MRLSARMSVRTSRPKKYGASASVYGDQPLVGRVGRLHRAADAGRVRDGHAAAGPATTPSSAPRSAAT